MLLRANGHSGFKLWSAVRMAGQAAEEEEEEAAEGLCSAEGELQLFRCVMCGRFGLVQMCCMRAALADGLL